GTARSEFPDKPITVLVSFDPGSTTDLIVRVLAVGAEKALGQRLVLENRGGGGGTVAMAVLANAKPDGYTVAVAPSDVIDYNPLVIKVTYKPLKSFTPIIGVAAAAKHLSPSVRIVGVQAEQAPSYFLSWTQKRVVPTETCNTLADGLATRTPDPQNVAQIVELVDDVVTVSEQQMLDAIRHLLLEEHIVAEGAGAASTAAWIQRSQPAGNTVLLMSGANVSQAVLQQALSRG
ncbi:MAG: pyridoxal-phosphate dependent enzyme, partial [Terriglobales bacterium]